MIIIIKYESYALDTTFVYTLTSFTTISESYYHSMGIKRPEEHNGKLLHTLI